MSPQSKTWRHFAPVQGKPHANEMSRQARSDCMLLRVWSRQSGSHYVVVDASKR